MFTCGCTSQIHYRRCHFVRRGHRKNPKRKKRDTGERGHDTLYDYAFFFFFVHPTGRANRRRQTCGPAVFVTGATRGGRLASRRRRAADRRNIRFPVSRASSPLTDWPPRTRPPSRRCSGCKKKRVQQQPARQQSRVVGVRLAGTGLGSRRYLSVSAVFI